MKYDDLVRKLGKQGWFDFPTLVQLSGEKRHSLQVQVYRWLRAGKLLTLRRGMYALPERYRRTPVNPVLLANRIYAPSYLSCHWALGYHGMIPERVVEFTSVTTRRPQRFENGFGTFSYRHIKQPAFFGYRREEVDGSSVSIAKPEKALLDLWHLEQGPWTRERMIEMRFQSCERVHAETMIRYAERYDSPRLLAATHVWLDVARERGEEGVEL